MMTKEIRTGAEVEIEAPLGTHTVMLIVAVKDGIVTFSRLSGRHRGKWGLPIDYVKRHGRLIQAPQPESAARMK